MSFMPKQRVAPNPHIAKNLATLMELKGLTSQPALSARSGVGQTTIGRILRGEVNAQAENLNKIALALGCDINVLFWHPDRLREMIRSGLPLHRLEAEKNDSVLRVAREEPAQYTISPRHAALIDLFEALPQKEQDELIKSLEDKKQQYEELLTELLQKRKA